MSARAQNSSRRSVNSSTSNNSRVRSTSARDRSSPYGSLTRRSNHNENRTSSSTTSQLVYHKRNSLNDRNNVFESHLVDVEQQQRGAIGRSDDDDDDNNDQIQHNTANVTISTASSQSNSFHATLTNSLSQNLSLNNDTTTTSTVIRPSYLNKNYVVGNHEVYKLFDKTTNDLYRCKLCQLVNIFFIFHKY